MQYPDAMSESDAASDETRPETHRGLQLDAPELERSGDIPDQFNIFEVIGLVRWETVHSRFLAFLLDPKQSHGLGNSFLADLLKVLWESTDRASLTHAFDNANRGDLAQTTAHTEVYTDDGRIDILLLNEGEGWAMIIENKIDTTEHHNQLDRYYRFVKTDYPDCEVLGAYLTPHGYDPSHANYAPLKYEAVCKIIENLLEEQGSTLNPDVRMSMEHYTRMVERHIVARNEVNHRSLKVLYALAAQQGNGTAFATIHDTAQRHGLYARTFPWSVMYTPPANRSTSLFTVGIYDKAGRGLSLWVSLEAWSKFYKVSQERVESIFGHERETEDVTPRLAREFADKLNRLFKSIESE